MTDSGNDWMFATLHCVVHLPQLTNFLLDERLMRSSLVTKRKNACEFASGLSELAIAYWSSSSETSSPKTSSSEPPQTFDIRSSVFDKVLDAFLRIHRSFKGKRHDRNAAEALRSCLETLHLAFGNVPDVEHPIRFDDDGDDDIRTTQRSIVSDVFEGVFDDGNTFTVMSINDTNAPTVVKSLESYTFRRTPLTFVVTLPEHFVSYDVNLTMIERGFQVPYALVAVLLHHHEEKWTALAYHDGQWRHFENDRVTPVPVNSIVQKNAAMLLYKRLLPNSS